MCARRDVSNSKEVKKRQSFFSLLLFYFFSFRFALFVSFRFVAYLSFFRTALPDRRAATARVLRQDVACRRSQKLLLGIFLHIHSESGGCVYVCMRVCVCAGLCVCVSARCSMSGDAGSSSNTSTGRLLKFCFCSHSSPSLSLAGSRARSPSLPLPPCTCAQFNFLLQLWQPPWHERQMPNAGAALPA